MGHALQTLGTILAGGSIAPAAVAIGGGGTILGAEIEAFDLGVNYPHEPCKLPRRCSKPAIHRGSGSKNENTAEGTRGQALNDAKRDAGVPTSQQPTKQENVPLTDSNGKQIVNDGKTATD